MSILGLSRWNKNWNVRNSYSYVATANKIRFHFQFPRSPDAEYGGLIGWLFIWKCKFSCRIISKIANYLKYNYFSDDDGIENVTSRLWKFSYFCSRHTVGVAGDDIMFHILVSPCVFVCARVCVLVYVCHDVCPDDLTMKDWCHTNNILQVHCWGCLVVQVMFHALMTSSMTSPVHKVGQILKMIYLRQYLS